MLLLGLQEVYLRSVLDPSRTQYLLVRVYVCISCVREELQINRVLRLVDLLLCSSHIAVVYCRFGILQEVYLTVLDHKGSILAISCVAISG